MYSSLRFLLGVWELLVQRVYRPHGSYRAYRDCKGLYIVLTDIPKTPGRIPKVDPLKGSKK